MPVIESVVEPLPERSRRRVETGAEMQASQSTGLGKALERFREFPESESQP